MAGICNRDTDTVNSLKHPRRPPLSDDCRILTNWIGSGSLAISVPAGYCREVTYGTCLSYVCAACRDGGIDSDTRGNANLAIIQHCVLIVARLGLSGILWTTI